MIRKKKGFELSFAWIFAIVAGSIIIITAIYAAIQLAGTGQHATNTMLAKQITILFNPLETGIMDGKGHPVILNQEARIYNKCFLDDKFGYSRFSASQKSGIVKEWPEPGGEITSYNKYVFSDKFEQGKKIYFFSKPFNMPFKIADILVMNTEEYCFRDAPNFVKNDLQGMGLDNIKFDDEENCSTKSIEVCFNRNCNISVYPSCMNCNNEYDVGYTEKNAKTVNFVNTGSGASLIYGSIFSDPEIYKCNFKRLMLRLKQISNVYSDELNFLASRGCGNSLSTGLLSLAVDGSQANADSAERLVQLKETAESVDDQNSAAGGCRIY